jgi:hypothetical protein
MDDPLIARIMGSRLLSRWGMVCVQADGNLSCSGVTGESRKGSRGRSQTVLGRSMDFRCCSDGQEESDGRKIRL